MRIHRYTIGLNNVHLFAYVPYMITYIDMGGNARERHAFCVGLN